MTSWIARTAATAVLIMPLSIPVHAQSLGCRPGMSRIEGYCIDRWEAHLVSQSPYAVPSAGTAATAPAVVPQGYISGAVASEACIAAGKRLCSDAEWLRACRGPDTTTYPYGNTYASGSCNDFRAEHPVITLFGAGATFSTAQMNDPALNQLPDTVDPTGANASCVSAEGVYDLHGNLNEWTSDPAGTFRGGYYVDGSINGAGCLYRTTAYSITYHDFSTGFRCCADAEGLPQVWDLAADWSDSSNPNAVWAYNEGPRTLPFVSDWQSATFATPQPGWARSAAGNTYLPVWFKSNGSQDFVADFQTGDIVVHSTDPTNGFGSGPANVTWTSTLNGILEISGFVWAAREIGRSNSWTLSLNGAPLSTGSVGSGDAFDRSNPFLLQYGSGGIQALNDIAVVTGDVVRLQIESTGNAGDFVGVALTIPEPDLAASLAVGVGLLAWALRRSTPQIGPRTSRRVGRRESRTTGTGR